MLSSAETFLLFVALSCGSACGERASVEKKVGTLEKIEE
jgi:hypothetical protein